MAKDVFPELLGMGSIPWFLHNPDPSVYLSDSYLILDFETTNLDKGSALNSKNRIVLATWSGADGIVHHKWGDQYNQSELLEAIAKADFIVAHNAKFELQWLHNCGVDISHVLVYDTMLGEYVLAGNRDWDLDLDSVAKRYGQPVKSSLIKTLMGAGVCPSDMPRSVLLKYGCADTDTTHHIFLQQRQRLKELNLLPILYTRCLTTTVLADIERNGMQLDEKRVNDEYNRVASALGELDAELFSITGGINPNSPKQLGEFVYDKLGFREITSRRGEPVRTPTGGRKTDADTLHQLEATTDEQRRFKDIIGRRQEENTKFKTIKKMQAACVEDGGILYARFNQHITQTHRLSSSGAKHKLQFQNFHRPYKSLFRAKRPGCKVGEADGMQLEFRAAVHLGRDAQGLEDVVSHVDVHKNTASELWGVPKAKVTKALRQDAKPETFRPLYGSDGVTPEQKRYASYFHDRYKDIYNVQTGWTYEVLEKKELVTEWGMRFYWPDTRMRHDGYITNKTNIFNYPVQCFATAEIIPISLVYFWHRVRAIKAQLEIICTIHDSIIAEVPPEEEELFNQLCKVSFLDDTYKYLYTVYGVKMTCPLGVETKIGEYWGSGEEKAFELNPS